MQKSLSLFRGTHTHSDALPPHQHPASTQAHRVRAADGQCGCVRRPGRQGLARPPPAGCARPPPAVRARPRGLHGHPAARAISRPQPTSMQSAVLLPSGHGRGEQPLRLKKRRERYRGKLGKSGTTSPGEVGGLPQRGRGASEAQPYRTWRRPRAKFFTAASERPRGLASA